ncbi:MAG: RNA methyltransferase [Bacteroidetes bacterium]|nr:RNA methyltransferase [Bacteroidota bacterium]
MVTKSQVKYIQSLGHKKFRDEEGVFVVEGPKIVGELLPAANMSLRQLFAVKTWLDEAGGLLRGITPAGAEAPLVAEVSESELERLSGLSTPNQVLAVFQKPVFPVPDFGAGVSLVLDGIQDPGNLGTIVRTADWFGLSRVFCSVDSADVFGPKTVQSTMGSISRISVTYGDPVELTERHPGLPVYAAVLEGTPLYGAKRIDRGFLVIGNESKGIRPSLLERATNRITIPRLGQAESLNAAVATGIILSHLV